jgi:glutathione S-transferase
MLSKPASVCAFVLQVLNEHLLHQTFLVGERITLADVAVACTLLSLYQHVLEPAFRQGHLGFDKGPTLCRQGVHSNRLTRYA